jgi:nucleotide-binding universal stress UspA family protein
MFKNILAATDLVSVSNPVVTAAAMVAQKYQANLHVLHVLESAHADNRLLVKHFKTGEEIVASADYIKTVENEISNTYAGLLKPSVNFEISVTPGFPWEEIIRYSRQFKAGLLVLGPHSGRASEKGSVRFAGKIGSTVEGVVMRENCPVMIVNPTAQINTAEFMKIVVGVDFSISCECALLFAVELARKSGGKIFPYHMIPVVPYPKYSRADYEADLAAAGERLEGFCGNFLNGVPYEYNIWGGALPHQEIIKCAAKKDADLIVMGSHTKKVDGKWYAGSAVERTGFRSNCPVIVVTDPDALLAWDESLLPESQIGKNKDRLIHVFSKHPHTKH